MKRDGHPAGSPKRCFETLQESAQGYMKVKRNSTRVTLADVAEAAGVSITTVSVVLSGREDHLRQFHPDTVTRVRECAERLGYRANLFASGLPGKSCPFFALVIRDFAKDDVTAWHHWAFEGDLLAGAIHAAAERDMYPIVTANPLTDAESLHPIERVISGGVLGAIVRSPNRPLERYLRQQMNRGHRIAVVFPDQLTRWPSNAITVENHAVGRIAAEALARQGRKRWGIVHYRDRKPRESHLARREAFQRIAQRVGASVEILSLPREMDDVGRRDLAQLASGRVDGLFGVDSVLSIDALQACLKVGLKPPDDISLVGVNCSRWQNGGFPRITSVEVSWRDVGVVAVRELMRMTDAEETEFDNVLIKPRVVAGDTCPIVLDGLPHHSGVDTLAFGTDHLPIARDASGARGS